MKSRNKTNVNMDKCDVFKAIMLKLVFWSLGNKVF